MGAFNEWAKGSFLEKPENRSVVGIAHNLLVGAASFTRYRWLSAQRIVLPSEIAQFRPLDSEQISRLMDQSRLNDKPVL
jgi:hypothetical protein